MRYVDAANWKSLVRRRSASAGGRGSLLRLRQLALGVLLASLPLLVVAQAAPRDEHGQADRLLTVDCLLPGQVRQLGNTTYLTQRRPVHTTLLGAGIPICEHMTGLGSLPDSGFRFSAAPPKVKGMGTFPVRAYAVLD